MACANTPCDEAIEFLLTAEELSEFQSMSDHSWVNTEGHQVPLKGAVWLLGKRYILPQDREEFDKDIYSRLWFSYRKNFRQIGDTKYSTDHGWGCTLRCGQMMLAHCLMLRHLGRNWKYDPINRDESYNKILEMFLDNRDSEYSIQMIALQGADFGRPVGQWFGPNNVAHAIKRLCQYDQWSKIAVYVALDMLVIIEDMKALCRQVHGIENLVTVEVTTDNGKKVEAPKMTTGGFQFSKSDPTLSGSHEHVRGKTRAGNSIPKIVPKRLRRPPKMSLSFSPTSIPNSLSRSYDPNADSALLNLTMEDFERQFSGKANLINHDEEEGKDEPDLGVPFASSPERIFRPLLLFIPLRLGQEKFNMEYSEALKACFSVPQTVGVIGGRPRHALWFIGCHNNHLLYFDPHTTQPSVPMIGGWIEDETYHLQRAERMPISELDPSLALGFFCRDEADLDDLCETLQSEVLSKMSYMFELTQHRPSYWGPPEKIKQTSREPFLLLEPDSLDSDEGFELVEWPYPAPAPEKGSWPLPQN